MGSRFSGHFFATLVWTLSLDGMERLKKRALWRGKASALSFTSLKPLWLCPDESIRRIKKASVQSTD